MELHEAMLKAKRAVREKHGNREAVFGRKREAILEEELEVACEDCPSYQKGRCVDFLVLSQTLAKYRTRGRYEYFGSVYTSTASLLKAHPAYTASIEEARPLCKKKCQKFD